MLLLAHSFALASGLQSPVPKPSPVPKLKAVNFYLTELKTKTTLPERKRTLKALSAFAAAHPESQPLLASALMEEARAQQEPFTRKAIVNTLVDLGLLASDAERDNILSFFLTLRRRSADLEVYDHLSWAIRQLRPESVLGEVY